MALRMILPVPPLISSFTATTCCLTQNRTSELLTTVAMKRAMKGARAHTHTQEQDEVTPVLPPSSADTSSSIVFISLARAPSHVHRRLSAIDTRANVLGRYLVLQTCVYIHTNIHVYLSMSMYGYRYRYTCIHTHILFTRTRFVSAHAQCGHLYHIACTHQP